MLEIVTYPNSIITRPCDDVTVFGQELKTLAGDMAEMMYASNGIGLAANQVGKSLRFVLVDQSGGDVGSELVELANPKIVWLSEERDLVKEGCLSLPGVELSITRSVACDVEYFDISGERKAMRCTGLKARIVQHEIDHLMGLTMLNKVGSLDRRSAAAILSRHR